MSSETERITNEVLNRRKWGKLEGHPDKASFEGTRREQCSINEPATKNRGSIGSGEAVLEPPH